MEIAGMFFAGMATAVFFGGLTMFLVAIVREGLTHRRSRSQHRSGPVGDGTSLAPVCDGLCTQYIECDQGCCKTLRHRPGCPLMFE